MASQEHLQQLTNDDDDSSSSSSSTSFSTDEDEDEEVNVSAAAPPAASFSLDGHDMDKKQPLMNVKPKTVSTVSSPLQLTVLPQRQPSQPATQPKMRIKLSMRRLPTKALAAENAGRVSTSSLPKKASVSPKTLSRADDDDEIKATIIDDSDEAGDVDAVAAVVETPPSPRGSVSKGNQATASAKTAAPGGSSNKRQRASNPVQRSIRLPPLSSPGLLLPTTSSVFRSAADSKPFATPSSVFDHAMSLAGYTQESRTSLPHRGSSVKRCVGDMFDSNVKLSLHFPELVPQDLLSTKSPTDEVGQYNGQKGESYAQILLRNLSGRVRVAKPQLENLVSHSDNKTSRKRRRKYRFDEMIPVSLTLPFPEGYIQKRLGFVQAVQNRENAIISFQEAEEAAEIAQERYEEALQAHIKKGAENGAPELPVIPAPIEIPPIPEPPSPPHLDECNGFPIETMSDDHPRYFPKDKEFLVSHLDRECFHITEGRYFGLMSSAIADPLFVGPNAPGVTGNLTASNALATVNTGSGSMGAAATAHSPGHAVLTIAPNAPGAIGSNNSKSGGQPRDASATTSKKQLKKSIDAKKMDKEPAESEHVPAVNTTSTPKMSSKKKKKGPTPTATSSSLRKIMEDGGEQAELMKNCIIRAAVYASRAGTHGQSFVGCNGESYPDISKAFAAHAGLKPCNRCKTNKQGAYHCRLRRKHKDLDYDGGNSPAVLAPLFQVPPEELIWKGPE